MQDTLNRGKAPRTLALWAALSLLVALMASGSATTAFAASPITVGGKAVVANTDGDPIRIRQDAGTEFPQIAMAYAGQSVSVLAGPRNDKAGSPWYKVQAPGGTGWMIALYLQGTSAPATATKLTGTARVANTNGDPLRMRATASTSGKVIALFNPGETVTVKSGPLTDETGTAWYEIAARGLTGWAMAQYLVQAQAATEPSVNTANTNTNSTQSKPAVTEKPTEKPTAEPTAVVKTQSGSGATSTLGQYRQWMEEARAMYPYPQSIDKMWRVMMCESGGNPRASGGGGRWLGLFQYAPGTWGGSWNPYRGNSIWDAKSQVFATAKAWSIGMQSHWSCYYITSGR